MFQYHTDGHTQTSYGGFSAEMLKRKIGKFNKISVIGYRSCNRKNGLQRFRIIYTTDRIQKIQNEIKNKKENFALQKYKVNQPDL